MPPTVIYHYLSAKRRVSNNCTPPEHRLLTAKGVGSAPAPLPRFPGPAVLVVENSADHPGGVREVGVAGGAARANNLRHERLRSCPAA